MSISVFRGFLNKTNYLIDLLSVTCCAVSLLHVTCGEPEQLVGLFVAVIKAGRRNVRLKTRNKRNITRHAPPAGPRWNYTPSPFQTVSTVF